VGTEVVVDGYQARDHSELRANARNVTFPDGRKLFLGSTGTGAPNPDEFPADKAKPPSK
jgi:selenocysteine lyase/cysteine desulfurase